MIVDLKFIVKCEILGLDESFEGSYFGHAFSKACQYVTTTNFFAEISSLFQSILQS
jgi:hypothetical protein